MPSNAAEALRTLGVAAARWQVILDTAQDAIICITSDGEISLFNAGAEQMFGYAAAEVMGRNVRMLMPAPYREAHSGYLRHCLETGAAKAIGRVRQVVAQRRRPASIELSVSESRVRNEILFNAIIRDTSERGGTHRAQRVAGCSPGRTAGRHRAMTMHHPCL
jgi:PAS domain S-box-containing protein